ncbi:MAG: chromosome segregation ATPase [Kiritimatiellia bacterium]|jgi:chromosome segregation ATPase
MLVDFTCPVCRTSLSVEDRVAGKKVDCPKCKELILIPLKPTSEKDNSGEDTVLRNIIPYRNEMLAKHNKLVEAIEEIKLRNERIRELEASSMRVQKELWSIEVEFEQRRDQFDKSEQEKRELKKKLNREGPGSAPQNDSELASLRTQLGGTRKQIEELTGKLNHAGERPKALDEAEVKLDTLSAQLSSLTASCEELSASRAETDQINTALKAEIGGLVAGLNHREEMTNQAYQQLQQLMEAVETYENILLRTSDTTRLLKDQNDGLAELGTLATQFNGRFSELNTQVKQIATDRDVLQQKVATQEKLEQAQSTNKAETASKLESLVADLETQLEAAVEKDAQLRRKYSELEDLNKSLENKVSSDAGVNERLAKMSASFKELQQVQLSQDKRASELNEENVKLKAKVHLANSASARIAELEEDRKVYHETFQDQEKAYHQMQGKYRQMEKVLNEERKATQSPGEGETTATGPDSALEQRLASLEQENADLKTAQSTMGQRADQGRASAHTFDELKGLRMKLSQLEIDSEDLSAENARLKNTVRTLTENLKAQWKKRDAKVHINQR